MKKIILSILIALCGICMLADNKNQPSQSIRITQLGDTSIRSRSAIECAYATWYPSSEIIEFELYGTGAGEVSIIDFAGNVIESISVFDGTTCAVISSPSEPGTYTIIISCTDYYGMGQFSVK